jgi:DNA-binding transcriptional MerR regulator
MDGERGMNISALARRTGVAADTLRKWEQRYGILRPPRTEGGQRRYTEADAARVEWLRDRLAEGYRIGEAAALLGGSDVAPAQSAGELVDALYGAAVAADDRALARRLDQTFALFAIERACSAVVEPLLRRVGDGWASGELTVAHEHLVSEAIRGRLETRLTVARGGVRGVAVLACAPGERHELGLLVAGTLLRADGWQVAYLGADTPLDDVFMLAERLDAKLVGISVTMDEHVSALLKGLRTHRARAFELALGGQAVTAKVARTAHARYVDEDAGALVAAVH